MKQILTSLLYLLTIVSVSHFVFEPANLYYELRWLDIPMHIMGGFGIASLIAAIYAYNNKKVSYTKLFILYSIVAIAWEVYEYAQDIVMYTDWSGWLDTLKDYIDGIIGISLAYLFIRT